MKTIWTLGLSKEVESDVRQNFKESTVLRKRAVEILSDMIEVERKIQVSKTLYDNPNWVYQQADKCGYERALRNIIELFSE